MLHSGPGGGEVTKLMDLQRQFKNYQTYAEFRDSDPEFVKDVVAALVEHKKEKATSGRPHRGAHANDRGRNEREERSRDEIRTNG